MLHCDWWSYGLPIVFYEWITGSVFPFVCPVVPCLESPFVLPEVMDKVCQMQFHSMQIRCYCNGQANRLPLGHSRLFHLGGGFENVKEIG
jgi:hypothetical protein